MEVDGVLTGEQTLLEASETSAWCLDGGRRRLCAHGDVTAVTGVERVDCGREVSQRPPQQQDEAHVRHDAVQTRYTQPGGTYGCERWRWDEDGSQVWHNGSWAHTTKDPATGDAVWREIALQ